MLANSLKNLSLALGIDKKDRIFTSDNPVSFYGSDLEHVEKIIFPLSSNLVLYLVNKDYIDTFNHIICFDITDYEANEINMSVAYNAESSILSKYLFNETELQQIRQARQVKKDDMQANQEETNVVF